MNKRHSEVRHKDRRVNKVQIIFDSAALGLSNQLLQSDPKHRRPLLASLQSKQCSISGWNLPLRTEELVARGRASAADQSGGKVSGQGDQHSAV